MSGGVIICQGFTGNDKSGSAYEGVLDALSVAGSNVVLELKAALDEAPEYILISSEQAAQMRPLLVSYHRQLVTEIGHNDWMREVEAEEEAGMDSNEAKCGTSRGWRLYCVTDLLHACAISVAKHEPVCIAFS